MSAKNLTLQTFTLRFSDQDIVISDITPLDRIRILEYIAKQPIPLPANPDDQVDALRFRTEQEYYSLLAVSREVATSLNYLRRESVEVLQEEILTEWGDAVFVVYDQLQKASKCPDELQPANDNEDQDPEEVPDLGKSSRLIGILQRIWPFK